MCIFSFECFRLEAKAAGPQASLTFLVANDSLGKVVFAHVVLQKGADPDHHSVDALVSIIMRLGYAQLALRSDNVPAILLLWLARCDRVQVGADRAGASQHVQTSGECGGRGHREASHGHPADQ